MRLFCITAVLLITARPVVRLMEKTFKTVKENGLTAKDSLQFILYSVLGFIFYYFVVGLFFKH